MVSSQDCLEWKILPHVDDGLKRKSSLLQGRFTGDPAYVFEHTITHRVGEGESAQEQTTNVSMHGLLPSVGLCAYLVFSKRIVSIGHV